MGRQPERPHGFVSHKPTRRLQGLRPEVSLQARPPERQNRITGDFFFHKMNRGNPVCALLFRFSSFSWLAMPGLRSLYGPRNRTLRTSREATLLFFRKIYSTSRARLLCFFETSLLFKLRR